MWDVNSAIVSSNLCTVHLLMWLVQLCQNKSKSSHTKSKPSLTQLERIQRYMSGFCLHLFDLYQTNTVASAPTVTVLCRESDYFWDSVCGLCHTIHYCVHNVQKFHWMVGRTLLLGLKPRGGGETNKKLSKMIPIIYFILFLYIHVI